MLLLNKFTPINQEELQQIRDFDKTYIRKTGQIIWFLPALYTFCSLPFSFFPIQDYKKNDMIMWLFWWMIVMTTYTIVMPYLRFKETNRPVANQQTRLSHLFKYLPVSKQHIIYVRMGYLKRFFRWYALFGVLFQCIGAYVSGVFNILNILYGIMMFFVFPMLIGFIILETD